MSWSCKQWKKFSLGNLILKQTATAKVKKEWDSTRNIIYLLLFMSLLLITTRTITINPNGKSTIKKGASPFASIVGSL